MLKVIFSFFILLQVSLFGNSNIKIGILAHKGYENTIKQWTATANYLTQNIHGYNFIIIPLTFEELKISVENKEIDFVLTNTMYYVELEFLYGVSRIATLKNLSSPGFGHTIFGGVIFTKQESPINHLTDLKGKSFGAVNSSSFGGWVMALKELNDNNINIKNFKKFEFLGSHDKVVLAVKDGLIDAGTVRTDTLERMEQEGVININDFKILSPKSYTGFPFKVSTALYPEWPFAKLSHTSVDLANKVLISLIQMPSNSVAAIDSEVEGWTIPLDYSNVHNLLQELHLPPYDIIQKITIADFYEKYKIWFYISLVILIGIISVLAYIFSLNKALRTNKKKIEDLNTNLEKKVQERTIKLQKSYAYEKYLKDVLKTIANVNELLISSISTQTIVQNSMETLIKHKHYKFVWIGLIDEDILKVTYQSSENKNIIEQKSYKLSNNESNLAFKSAFSSLDINTTSINKLPLDYKINIGEDFYECSNCWVINIPIKDKDNATPMGNISVFSNRDEGFEPEEIKMLENLCSDIAMALQSIKQRTMLEAMELEKISNYEETILAFVNIIEQRDSYTAGHTIRVAQYCRKIALAMELNEKEIIKLEKAAILHDIGKVVTPDAILLKPGSLNPLEYELIKQHAYAGYKMLSKIDMYKDLAEIIRYHHVRYDGNGYPHTPKNDPDSIPLLSYIMAVADAFDAMTSNRIYKPRKTIKNAIEEIKTNSGSQFHPKVVDAAIKAFEDIHPVETTQLPENELEQRRFAYFFMDSLTELYNEDYLKTFLLRKEDEFRCMYVIKLKKFTNYNKKNGWDQGNVFLKNFAQTLVKKYHNATIFRYHGDDFILLFKSKTIISKKDIESLNLIIESELEITVEYYDLSKEIPTL
ncbi:PhnD/SsuA/transferrin family substrate-binding protein [Arcobacter sp. FWKO B]|uniref:PhnD/SsuA/transferrin family substrate-binding protein n=1 Tax=Arcobacter sp. FWKO B TaxID=2593672 RepID=UPI0018A6992D|nr:HD domain-containing phosphohydrolase [Arcobacter sp. FWKO B]QOG12328.1 PhnD/SsuA/transferrin family substrate-binding protein [Arcobacter sp. FWKO B]